MVTHIIFCKTYFPLRTQVEKVISAKPGPGCPRAMFPTSYQPSAGLSRDTVIFPSNLSLHFQMQWYTTVQSLAPEVQEETEVSPL